jgi:hypothetical protein
MLMIVPDPTDATSYYRSISPFSHVKKEVNIHFQFTDRVNWPVIKMADIVFMQRPCRNEDLQIAQMTKDNHKPLWVDYDDDLFTVQSDNPSYLVYNQPAIKKNITALLTMADVVTVTTEALKTAYSHLNKNIIVCPNGIDDDLIKDHELPKGSRKDTIMWRGSQTHERDLMSVADSVLKIAKAFDTFKWSFIGYNPWFITDQIQNCGLDAGRDIPNYFKLLKDQAPGFFICPLADNIFNRSKSNIAWIEATYAGALCLAPNWPEWQKPGCLNYLDPKDFEKSLDIMLYDKSNGADAHVEQSWQYIKSELIVSKINHKRLNIIESLI